MSINTFVVALATIVAVVAATVALLALNQAGKRRESVALAQAEAAREKLQRLQRITDVALAHVSADELLRELLARLRQVLHADTVAIFLLDEATGRLVLGAAAGLEEGARRDPTPIGQAFIGHIAAEREARLGRLEDFVKGFLYERGVRAVVGAPLLGGGRLRGVVRAGATRPDAFTADDVDLLRLAADRITLALDNARLYEAARRARDEAEAVNRAKDLFLAVLSHELRTPLTPILGWARTLRRHDVGEEIRGRALDAIERNARLQTQLIDDLLDVSRIVSGKLQLDRHAVNVGAVIDAAIDAVRSQADAKAIKVDVAFTAASDVVWGDANRLQQVVWNLLSNAVKFTPTGGAVTIRLEADGADSILTVRDTGKGIAPEILPGIFEPFRQADSTTTTRHGGLGLGLTIVRHLVELHGGGVTAESPGEGRGAVFTVRLPLMPTPLGYAPPAERAPETAAGTSLEGLHVLLVEDERDTRELLAALLELHHAEVRAVGSADEALPVLRTDWPRVLVSDLRMADTDGYTLVRALRALERERGGRLPAVALTAYASQQDADRAFQAGFDRHLAKPVSPEVLVRVLGELAGQPSSAG